MMASVETKSTSVVRLIEEYQNQSHANLKSKKDAASACASRKCLACMRTEGPDAPCFPDCHCTTEQILSQQAPVQPTRSGV